MFKRTRYTKKQFINAVKNNYSIASALRELKLKVTGANYKYFKFRVNSLGLSTSHFTGQGHMRGKTHNRCKRSLKEILVEGSDYLSTNSLKKRLLKATLLENKCYECNLTPEWNGKRLVMHLDHIDGVNNDNRIENLRLLCPNCHSQTSTYAGKNKTRAIPKSPSPRKPRKPRKQYFDCNKEISKVSKRCKSCAGKTRESTKIKWPPIEKLIKMVEESNYSATGRTLGVSDNAIRKRIKNHK